MSKEIKQDIIQIKAVTLKDYTQRAIEATDNGYSFKDGRVIGFNFFANFVKEVEVEVPDEDTGSDTDSENGESIASDSTPNSEEDGQTDSEDLEDGDQGTSEEASEDVDSDTVELDAEYLESLTTKEAVEAYGKEFGVDLDKRKALKTMKSSLVDALA